MSLALSIEVDLHKISCLRSTHEFMLREKHIEIPLIREITQIFTGIGNKKWLTNNNDVLIEIDLHTSAFELVDRCLIYFANLLTTPTITNTHEWDPTHFSDFCLLSLLYGQLFVRYPRFGNKVDYAQCVMHRYELNTAV